MNWKGTILFGLVFSIASFLVAPGQAQDFHFDSTISRQVLQNYLNRSIHYTELLHDSLPSTKDKRGADPHDNIRMLLQSKAKYVGRAIMNWGFEEDFHHYASWLSNAKRMIDTLHSVDPDMILEAAEFEIIDTQANLLAVPASVFTTFGQPVVTRNFIYKNMLYDNNKFVNNWGTGASVPDMSKLETRMYYYFLACNYIDIGIEAFHFGQIGLMDQADPTHSNWMDMLTKVRAYGRAHARRHMVLCNAHTPYTNPYPYVVNGHLLFDFHAFPMRIAQSGTTCCKGVLQVGYSDALYGKTPGGITPSGWSCTHIPWLAEFDNFGSSNPGSSSPAPFVWGYDEITFFAHMAETDRDAWLHYAWNWMPLNDTTAHLAMPGSRVLSRGPTSWYWANTLSTACPQGYNTESTIRDIWGTATAVAPRPAAHVAFVDPATVCGLSILTVSGKLVAKIHSPFSKIDFEKSNIVKQLSKGVYLYSITTPSGNLKSGKFMVNK